MVDCIKSLQERIRAYEATLRENETRTRMALIDPLLKALGWNIGDPGMVTPEHKVSGGWADYALLRPDGIPAATVEAKKLGTQLKDDDRAQMLKYAITDGIKYAGLTDGNNWELYNIFQPVKLEEKRILEVSIADESAYASALKLLLLWRPNLASGEPVKVNGPILDPPPPPPPSPSGCGRKPMYSGKKPMYSGKFIKLLRDDNPRREESWGYKSWNIVANNGGTMLYDEYVSAGGRYQDLKWDIDRKWAEVANGP